MINFLKKLIIVAVGLLILVGIPYYFGVRFFIVSWIPALVAMTVLDE